MNIYTNVYIHGYTNINHIHKLFSVFSLILKMNRQKVCFPPMLHCQGPFIQSSYHTLHHNA